MEPLNDIMFKNTYQTETKVRAIQAIGDICLAVGDKFNDYLEKSMQCLNQAAILSLKPVNNNDEDLKMIIH